MSDFELKKKTEHVRFWIENNKTCQILNKKFYNVLDFKLTIFIFFNLKVWPSPTTCTFHIVFLHITMYSYRLQYLLQLDNSIRLRSYNTFCTLFRKDFHFWFRYEVPISFLNSLDICKNQLLLIVKLQQLIQF